MGGYYKIMYVGSFISSIGQEIKVRATNGLFTRYVFTKKGNEPLVKRYMNVFIYYVLKNNSLSNLELLGDNIEITAEYNYYKNKRGMQPTQDFKVVDDNRVIYLEIQTEIDTKNPLFGRAIIYYALSITEAIGTTYEKTNQLWLCVNCEDGIVDNSLAFEEYLFRGSITGKVYPKTSSITVIDLSKLSKSNLDFPAVRLAKYLVTLEYTQNSDIQDIVTHLQNSFDEIKKDKQRVIELEDYNIAHYEGRTEGRAEGISQGRAEEKSLIIKTLYSKLNNIDKLLELLPNFSKEEINKIIKGE